MSRRMHGAPASTLAALRGLAIFEDLDAGELARVDGLTCEVSVPAGRILMRQGHPGSESVLVVSGDADVVIDGRAVSRVAAGDVVGEMALLDGRPRSATVVAATDMRLLVLDRGQFAELMQLPGAALAIADRASRRR
jgi:CRP/FNR family transcriptional regulator, cyclic AMP receptor protein